MPDSTPSTEPLSQTADRGGGNGKKAAITVAIIVVIAVAVVAFINRDRLMVHSDVLTPPATTPSEAAVANQFPEILSLMVASDRIEPFSLCDVVCEAIDPDGDALTYEWSASAGDIFGEGSEVEWGSPVSEGLYRLAVTVNDGRGGFAEYSVPVRVQANVAPALGEMVVDSEWVLMGGSAWIACNASDADGDALTFEWSATDGELYGEGSAVIWVAPQVEGVHWVEVIVRDGYGGESRRSAPVSVSAGKPPVIDGVFVKGVNTDMLRKIGNDWMIYQGRTCSLTCAVIDEGAQLTYEWSVDFGTLDAAGPIATWTAPAARVAASIVVLVTDERGSQSSASTLINVETCTCSF